MWCRQPSSENENRYKSKDTKPGAKVPTLKVGGEESDSKGQIPNSAPKLNKKKSQDATKAEAQAKIRRVKEADYRSPELTPDSQKFDEPSESQDIAKGYMTVRNETKEKIEMAPNTKPTKVVKPKASNLRKTFGLKKNSIQPSASTSSLNKTMKVDKGSKLKSKRKMNQSMVENTAELKGDDDESVKSSKRSTTNKKTYLTRPASALKSANVPNSLNTTGKYNMKDNILGLRKKLVNPELSSLMEKVDENDDDKNTSFQQFKDSFSLKSKGKE